MKVIKPKKLNKGDLIGIITPASTPDNLEKINLGVNYLESLGYSVIVGKNVGKFNGYLAGDDESRVRDLHDMFADKRVKAIIAARGGYGTIRILSKLNYKLIKSNPKILVGYSDLTALQLAIFSQTGLISFSGPMAAVEMANGIDPYTEEIFWKMITYNKKFGHLTNPETESLNVLKKGNGQGILLGGNLSLVISLLGSKYSPNYRNSLMFIEDVDEKPYKIDKYLAQLQLNGILSKIKGTILCEFSDCNETDPNKKTLSLNEVIYDYFNDMKTPVIYNFKYGHIPVKATMPIGIKAKINSKVNYIDIIENCVS